MFKFNDKDKVLIKFVVFKLFILFSTLYGFQEIFYIEMTQLIILWIFSVQLFVHWRKGMIELYARIVAVFFYSVDIRTSQRVTIPRVVYDLQWQETFINLLQLYLVAVSHRGKEGQVVLGTFFLPVGSIYGFLIPAIWQLQTLLMAKLNVCPWKEIKIILRPQRNVTARETKE